MLRRQSSLNQLFGTVRLALHDPQVNIVLLHDWQRQDLHTMTKNALQAASNFHLNDQGQQFRKRRSTETQPINPATVEFVAACKLITFSLFHKFNGVFINFFQIFPQLAASLSGY